MFDVENIKKLPKEPGVYLMKDQNSEVLYIGKAKNLKVRLKQYFDLQDTRAMIPFLLEKVVSIETIVTTSEKEALLLENNLIKKYQPKYNALLKDDKTFVSLMVNHKHPYPMIKLVRHKGAPAKDGLYFGPYTNSLAARETFDVLRGLFPLRQCSDQELISRKRPCILYSIKKCLAPCVKKCTQQEYNFYVDQTIEFLKGHDASIVKELKRKMQEASDRLEFEKAADFLRTIKQLEHVQENSKSLVHSHRIDSDVIGLFKSHLEVVITILNFREGKLIGSSHFCFKEIAQSDEALLQSFLLQNYQNETSTPKEILIPFTLENKEEIEEILKETLERSIKIICPEKGEKKELIDLAYSNSKTLMHQKISEEQKQENSLQELQNKLSLSRFPMVIECFDTSNISGSSAVASMVCFVNGKKCTNRYRTYKIKGDATDDYNAMKEVLKRRYEKKELDLPDLIIVDGGKGQLHVAQKILKELEIASCDLIALAKEEARHDKGLTQERVFILDEKEPIIFSKHSSVLFLLQQIRDEAHRKAISFHRLQRGVKLLKSELDELNGIGPKKKELLLKRFGSVKKIKDAKKEELEQIKSLTKKDIETLLKFQKT